MGVICIIQGLIFHKSRTPDQNKSFYENNIYKRNSEAIKKQLVRKHCSYIRPLLFIETPENENVNFCRFSNSIVRLGIFPTESKRRAFQNRKMTASIS